MLVVNAKTPATKLPIQDLRRYGHTAEVVRTGRAALQRYTGADLVLLDPDLPDIDGIEVCQSLRALSEVPIIMLTSRGSELDQVLGLRAGSDDYLVSPVGNRELMARIDAVARRTRGLAGAHDAQNVIVHGRLRIDPATRRVHVDERPVSVTRKEFDLLHALASQPWSVVSRRQLMTSVWSTGIRVTGSRTLDAHVNSLRTKLGSRDWILTVRGIGFRLGPSSSAASYPNNALDESRGSTGSVNLATG
ncbi:response regulator transcription factor [Kineosporia corallincola]|uniref:response regulator transcription factor n=1 Tax=Kineosporia corallincola TaxID=2835133 RepID=UPI0027E1A3EC|nr:response regulator transcription factor [Kineosporia corallincola]